MKNISTGRSLSTLLLFAIGLLVACGSSHSLAAVTNSAIKEPSNDSAPPEALPSLITADELAKLLESNPEDVKILEPGTDLKVFSKGHLPAAQFLHWIDDMTDPATAARYNNPSPKQFAELMSRLGIKSSDRVVIYDRLSSRLSTRLFWTFKTLGHDRVQVLDGGFGLGKSKLELSNKTLSVTPSEYKVVAPKNNLIADLEMVQNKLIDPNCRLIDGRPEEQFSGEKPGAVYHTKRQHSREGHIPGAKNVFWKDNFNPDGTFKTAAKLKTLYRSADILPTNDVITYCNEGLHAAPPWFVLTQLLEYKNVRLYDSSMAEWAESKQPMTTLPKDK